MVQHIHKSQLGFIQEGECPIHIIEAIREMKLVKTNSHIYPEAGFLFIDFQQAFDSVDHQILMKKINKFKGSTNNWKQAVHWYLN